MVKEDYAQDEAFGILKMLVSTNTVNPPGNERLLAEKMAALFAGEGIRAELQETAPGRCNMLARIPGKRRQPALLVTGHIDTVPAGVASWPHDPFGCCVENGLVYGRGVADMKGSVAALMYAMFLMQRRGVVPEQDIVFCATCDEECACSGAAAFVEKGGMRGIGAVFVGEPSNGDMLVAHKGAMWAKVQFHGRTAHGSMPHLGVNAVNRAVRFVQELNKQQFSCAPDKWLGMPTFSVNMFHGGVAVNVVPDFAECMIDIRTIPGQTQADAAAFIESALARAAEGDADFKAAYEFIISDLPVACPEGDPILDALDAAAGRKLLRRGVNYYTDASVFLAGRAGMPVVIYGPGDDKQAHQPDEHISVARFYEAIEIYYKFMSTYKI